MAAAKAGLCTPRSSKEYSFLEEKDVLMHESPHRISADEVSLRSARVAFRRRGRRHPLVSRGHSAPPQDPWVVREWKRRGLLSPSSNVHSQQELVELTGDASWFVRRNRRTPHSFDSRIAFDDSATSWVARRNWHSQARFSHGVKSRHSVGEHLRAPKLEKRNSAILLDIQARLPQPPKVTQLDRDGEQQKISDGDPNPVGSSSSLLDARRHEHGPQVFLTLYDLTSTCVNSVAHAVGLGVYHSGIEVYGIEYAFDNHTSDGCGVVWHVHCRRESHTHPRTL